MWLECYSNILNISYCFCLYDFACNKSCVKWFISCDLSHVYINILSPYKSPKLAYLCVLNVDSVLVPWLSGGLGDLGPPVE